MYLKINFLQEGNYMKNVHTSLIILGAGPAGYTAAIYAARANIKTTLITGPNPGGQLTNTDEIENWPGNPEKITGIELMNRMLQHVKNFPINIITDTIKKVNFKKNPFLLVGEDAYYSSKSVIIATGATPRYLNISSEKKYIGKGISTCSICDGFFYKNKIIAIIGGGNTAIEEAMYLSKIVKKVYLIHRGNTFTADKILLKRISNKNQYKNIKFYFNCVTEEILGDQNGVNGINIKNKLNNTNIVLDVVGIFLAIGHIPNTKIFSNELEIKNNYLIIDKKTMHFHTKTSINGIFAAGDVSDFIYKQAITAAASGCMAALDAEKYLNSIE